MLLLLAYGMVVVFLQSITGAYIATGVYRYIYLQNQSTLQIFMWLLVVFFLFDPGKLLFILKLE